MNEFEEEKKKATEIPPDEITPAGTGTPEPQPEAPAQQEAENESNNAPAENPAGFQEANNDVFLGDAENKRESESASAEPVASAPQGAAPQQPKAQEQSIYSSNVYPYNNVQQQEDTAQSNVSQAQQYYNNSQPYSQYANAYNPVQVQPPVKKKKRIFPIIIAVIVVLCVVGGIIGMVLAGRNSDSTGTNSGKNESGASLEINDSPNASDTKNDTDELTTVGLIKKVADSCVMITAETTTNTSSPFGGSLGSTTSTSYGSGVLMLEDAKKGVTYVVTCAHVIDTANSTFVVTLNDKTQYNATVVGYDTRTDVGVLSIEATGLKIAEFGDSDALEKGQTVVAIGNPGGESYFNSPTQGIVSGIDAPVRSSIGYTNKCIQHSAAINPGNSGGALFNSYGQVVGINSSKIAETDYEGMGFAVPSKTVQEVVNALIEQGYVSGRAQLGISFNAISSYQNYNVLVAAGLPEGAIVIVSFNETNAFAGTDVQAFDIITAVNGNELTSVDMLTSALSESSPGEQMKLTVARIENNKSISTFDVTVTLIEGTE